MSKLNTKDKIVNELEEKLEILRNKYNQNNN